MRLHQNLSFHKNNIISSLVKYLKKILILFRVSGILFPPTSNPVRRGGRNQNFKLFFGFPSPSLFYFANSPLERRERKWISIPHPYLLLATEKSYKSKCYFFSHTYIANRMEAKNSSPPFGYMEQEKHYFPTIPKWKSLEIFKIVFCILHFVKTQIFMEVMFLWEVALSLKSHFFNRSTDF